MIGEDDWWCFACNGTGQGPSLDDFDDDEDCPCCEGLGHHGDGQCDDNWRPPCFPGGDQE